MKEPWQVYDDEFLREVKRRRTKGREITLEEFGNAEYAAAEATAYHLVNALHWHPEDAADLVEHLRKTPIPGKGEGSWHERLRHAQTDWELSHRRGRA